MSEDSQIDQYLYKSDRENNIYSGIYIHIPFCIKKCPYCNFYSTSDISLKKTFVLALLKEIEMRSDLTLLVDTIYFGGGTPSLLTCGEMARIIEVIRDNFHLMDNRTLKYKNFHNSEYIDESKTTGSNKHLHNSGSMQITMEVNPGTIKEGYLKQIRDLGVSRLSIGVQSFDDTKLRFLERIHSSDAARQTILSARDAGFDNISIDLIYGLPGETEGLWLSDLETALEYCPEHLSCYMLSYEHDTPMFEAYQSGEITPLDDEYMASLFRLTSEYLVSKGFIHYEVSNFASSPKHESIHNKKYWKMVPYLGFGPSAHSYYCESSIYNSERFWNVRSVHQYISVVDKGSLPIGEREKLTHEQQLIEMIMVGLRRDKGIDIRYFERLYSSARLYVDDEMSYFTKRFEQSKSQHSYEKPYTSEGQFTIMFKDVLEQIKQRSWGKIDSTRCSLTTDGWLFLDTVTRWFVDALSLPQI